MILLDHRGALGRLALPNDRGAVAFDRAIFAGLTDRHAGPHGPDTHADFISQRWRRERAHKSSSNKILFHCSSPADRVGRQPSDAPFCSAGTSIEEAPRAGPTTKM